MSTDELDTVSLTVPFQAPSASFVRTELKQWLLDKGFRGETVDDARVVVSELVGNSVRHAHPLPVNQLAVAWFVDGDDLVISVTDGGSGTSPHPISAAETAVSGRGLSIVEALVAQWWVEDDRDATTVHVRIPLGPAR
ncbi:ATP-binding protein [Nocardioides marmoribigeumensis]|jgi:anti-sigma regulatory factor (Ser/Thr protein kinase)|uniref:Anti-sigma regulatory factor (Ser/Thr protein kinase) n=1 Tax=Nocardioides marmoribigeumensis TaxID=433649 RepID=A0ABU2BWU4_9ACTN|nr:ATP-binding protein [Nocardioides marmoribigeumensis]MDR7362194.1 anti-sigma regulatory factor (Ser/Thr protein kinase) [Nocardioides marmoribigeumensis]